MKSKAPILCLILLCVSGCEEIEIGRPFDCHMGTNYEVTNDLSFTINSLNDSRCPENAVCCWAGEVHIIISVYLSNNVIDTVLYQDPSASYPIRFGGYGFGLLNVVPISTGTRTSKDITITMLISKI
ncbi:MAG: hypothetical protein NT092_14500 [Bacteroidia bacterium]|nr:hypothetical protein [Bacteroidia bacterium]